MRLRYADVYSVVRDLPECEPSVVHRRKGHYLREPDRRIRTEIDCFSDPIRQDALNSLVACPPDVRLSSEYLVSRDTTSCPTLGIDDVAEDAEAAETVAHS